MGFAGFLKAVLHQYPRRCQSLLDFPPSISEAFCRAFEPDRELWLDDTHPASGLQLDSRRLNI
jgi:hypothetical protein